VSFVRWISAINQWLNDVLLERPNVSWLVWLAKWGLLCAAFFFWRQGREMKRWDRWKADYCRALDRLKVPEA
jgi:hypothetical protein